MSSVQAGASDGKNLASHDSEGDMTMKELSGRKGRAYSRRHSRSPSPVRDRYKDERRQRKRKRHSTSISPERERYATPHIYRFSISKSASRHIAWLRREALR